METLILYRDGSPLEELFASLILQIEDTFLTGDSMETISENQAMMTTNQIRKCLCEATLGTREHQCRINLIFRKFKSVKIYQMKFTEYHHRQK